MSAETTCRFEELDRGVLAVTLRPELNEVPWTDIERIGSGIVERVAGRDRPRVVVDLTELNHMGSAMVALVVRIWKAVSEKNGRMIVVNRNDLVSEVLQISGLAGKWTIVPTREEALASFGVAGGTPAAAGGRAGLALVALCGVFLLLGVLGVTDAVSNGVVADSLGRAATFWIGVGCAVAAAVFGVVAAVRTDGGLRIAAVVLTTLSVVAALASLLFVA
ncbi:MAG TPA: STAS domain-containing protein [Planctomycetaceae bacterium]